MEGNNLKETAKTCGVPESTLYTWHSDNYLNLADKIERWKIDRKIALATGNLEEMLQMETRKRVFIKGGEEEKEIVTEEVDPALVRVKADMTKFTLETLDKDNYSKRTDLTTKDKEINAGVIIMPKKDVDTLETNPETSGSAKED